MPLIKLRVNQRDQGYQWLKAREPRQCKLGHAINQGEIYVRFFSLDKTTDSASVNPSR